MDFLKILEIIAVISGILCVYLQTQEKILAWPFGILSVSLSVIIFIDAKLYSDVLLHLVYIFLNIYGWWNWIFQRKKGHTETAPILLLKGGQILLWSLVVAAGTFFLGSGMGIYTDAELPYFDAFTTSGSLVAQYLLARKVLHNWLLWIIVDLVAVNVYLYKGLYFFSFLFFVYLLLCIKGYLDWRRHIQQGKLL